MFTRWSDTRNSRAAGDAVIGGLPEPQLRAPLPQVIHAAPPAQADANLPPPLPNAVFTEEMRMSAQIQATAVNGHAATDAAGHSVIGKDLAIEGQAITIRCRGALEINGSIQAELHSKTLLVGETGIVEGAVWADTVDVRGKVCGTIKGSRVVLHPSAEVEGDIHAKTLSVSDGATFEGRSRRVTDAATVAPNLDGSQAAATVSGEAVPVPVPRVVPAMGVAG